VGTTAGNVIEITAPAAQYKDITYGDRDGQLAYTIPLALGMVNGDDELQITFT
jgi:hypothetical protein